MTPDFSSIPPNLHELAEERWNRGDASGLFNLAPHKSRGYLLLANVELLKQRGMYEQNLYGTYIHGPHLSPGRWRRLFEAADRSKLAALGEALPDKPVTVYRGVSDAKHREWRRGLSWTLEPRVAAWFATRHAGQGEPAVYSLRVEPESILVVTNERSEAEVVVAIWECGRTKRVIPMPEPRKPR